MYFRQIIMFLLTVFFIVASSSLLGCLCEQNTEQPNKDELQLPYFDSVVLSGSPLNNIHQVNPHADAVHANKNLTSLGQPSNIKQNEGMKLDKPVGAKMSSLNLNKHERNASQTAQEQQLLPALQRIPLLQNLLRPGSKLAQELNMTIYVIKEKNDHPKPVSLNKSNSDSQQTSFNNKTTSSDAFRIPNNETRNFSKNTSRKAITHNITVFLDIPESVESLDKVQLNNQTSDFQNMTIIKEGQNIQKTWSWNQRTRGRWPSRGNGWGRYRWRRPTQGRRPSSGGRWGQGRVPQGGWQRPGQGGSQVSNRPSPGIGPGVTGPGEGTGGGVGNSGGSSTSQGDSDFEQEALDTHNKFRAVHNAAPMRLNNDLNQQAKAYAQKLADLGTLDHSSSSERGQDVGENLAMGCSSFGDPLSGKKAVANWYNEVCKYDFNNPGFSMDTGHFTQVVWQDSTELGIGKAISQKGQMPCVYVVGRYKLAGNFNDMFGQQVLRGAFDPSYCNNVKK